jgi:hypothetical protein
MLSSVLIVVGVTLLLSLIAATWLCPFQPFVHWFEISSAARIGTIAGTIVVVFFGSGFAVIWDDYLAK